MSYVPPEERLPFIQFPHEDRDFLAGLIEKRFAWLFALLDDDTMFVKTWIPTSDIDLDFPLRHNRDTGYRTKRYWPKAIRDRIQLVCYTLDPEDFLRFLPHVAERLKELDLRSVN